MRDKKTIIIGIDGADFRYIDSLIEEKKVPNIEEIIKEGFSAEFNSSEVPFTSQAWANIITGRDPGEHWVYDTRTIDKDYKEKISHSQGLPVSYFWDYLSEKGKRTIVVNVPMVYPAKKCNGIVISGFDAPLESEEFSYPRHYLEKKDYNLPELQKELSQIEDVEKEISKFKEGVWTQYAQIKKIMEKENWDCFFSVFHFVDWVSHKTRNKNVIEKIYIEIDKVLGEIKKEYPKVNFFILSDHGNSPAFYRFSVNKLLFDLGLLKIKKALIDEKIIYSGLEKAVKNKKIANFCQKIYRNFPCFLKKTISGYLFKKYPHLLLRAGKINFEKTKAFYFGLGSIYVNSRKKFSKGNLIEKEAAEIKEMLKSNFEKIKDKKGRKIIECFEPIHIWRVNKKNNIYVLPDLLIRANIPGYYIKDIGFSGNLLEKIEKNIGVHFKTGILIGAGPDIPNIKERMKANLIDFAPTLFSVMGLPIPFSFVGKSILKDTKKERYKSEKCIEKKDEALTPEQEEEIKETLKNLGYF